MFNIQDLSDLSDFIRKYEIIMDHQEVDGIPEDWLKMGIASREDFPIEDNELVYIKYILKKGNKKLVWFIGHDPGDPEDLYPIEIEELLFEQLGAYLYLDLTGEEDYDEVEVRLNKEYQAVQDSVIKDIKRFMGKDIFRQYCVVLDAIADKVFK